MLSNQLNRQLLQIKRIHRKRPAQRTKECLLLGQTTFLKPEQLMSLQPCLNKRRRRLHHRRRHGKLFLQWLEGPRLILAVVGNGEMMFLETQRRNLYTRRSNGMQTRISPEDQYVTVHVRQLLKFHQHS
jgi:hypothetical protein